MVKVDMKNLLNNSKNVSFFVDICPCWKMNKTQKNTMLTDFYKKQLSQSITLEQQRKLEATIEMCSIFSKLNNQSIYLVDYSAHTFFYISQHPLLLCGYKIDETITNANEVSTYGL